MAFEQKEGRWSLFRNKEKQSENSPEYSGSININGTLYRLNGWVDEGSTGKFFSGSVRLPRPVIEEGEDVPF